MAILLRGNWSALRSSAGHADHVRAFVEGMFARLGIEITQRLHGGVVWEIRVPENLREALPRFSARQRVTLDRTWAAERRDVHMLDMESPLMRLLLTHAKATNFGGRTAMLYDLSGNALLTAVLRWQNNHGVRMRQEFTALQLFDDGRAMVNPETFSRWLLEESSDGTTAVVTGEVAKGYFARAKALTDKRLGLLANTDLQPENRQWVSAGWLGD